MAVALFALAAFFLAVPLILAYSAVRNGNNTCDLYTPTEFAFSDQVVRIKYQVSVLPLAIECSYTTEQNPAASDYVVTSHDIGTPWWIGAPIALTAAVVAMTAGARGSRRS